jgi:Putative auto-transporter adhesin, head GIN domain
MRLALLIASAAILAIPAIAAADTVVPVQRFESIELRGGGKVVIRQGPVQKVTLREGTTEFTHFDVSDRGGQLIIRTCSGDCPFHYRMEVEIETPGLGGASVVGGGDIVAEGPFRQQTMVSAAVKGGGKVDLRALPGGAVSAAVNGGGVVLVSAQTSLSAAVNGGGSIRYSGQPSVNSAIHGGGSVSPAR